MNTDEAFIDYRTLGSVAIPGPTFAPYNLGRTLTHEFGHMFGLEHTFNPGCNGDENSAVPGSCDDTPNIAEPTSGCPTGVQASCGSISVMYQNYMDYTDDLCMVAFTPCRAEIMLNHITTLNTH